MTTKKLTSSSKIKTKADNRQRVESIDQNSATIFLKEFADYVFHIAANETEINIQDFIGNNSIFEINGDIKKLDVFWDKVLYDEIELYIKKKFTNYINDQLLHEKNPLQFFSKFTIDQFKLLLLEYLKTIKIHTFPKCFEEITSFVVLQFNEFQNIVLYINHNNENVRIIQDSIRDLETTSLSISDGLNGMSNNIDKQTDKLKMLEENVESLSKKNTETAITILGIFASIILTFHGVISFASSVIANMEKASIYRVVLIALIVGLVGITLLFGLIYYLNEIYGKNNNKTYLIVFIVSITVILSLILLDFVAWNCKWVEKRNLQDEVKITSETNSLSTQKHYEMLLCDTLFNNH